MKNVIICKNCSAENPFYGFICSSCRSYLRERIVNIDLWDTLGSMLYSPVNTFSRIIHAEHKNFIFFIVFLAALKFCINIFYFSTYVLHRDAAGDFFTYFMVALVAILVSVFLFSFILRFLNSLFGIKSRFKDNAAILIYSLVPHIYALLFLFTVEVVLFGSFIFSYNPSPFILKPNPAYILAGMEFILIIWSFALSIAAIYSLTKSKFYSFIMAIVFSGLIFFNTFLIVLI